MVGAARRGAGRPRDDESGEHAALRLDPGKKSRRAAARREERRAAWREPLRGVDPARFVGVDATGRDLGLTRPSSRAPRGQRAQATAPGTRGANRTAITALTVDGCGPGLLLDEALDRATSNGDIVHGPAPTPPPDRIVVVDTLKLHHSDRAPAAIEARGARLRSLPASAPDLAPLEAAFSTGKAAVRTGGPRTGEAHSTAVRAALRTITPHDAAGWIAHAGQGPAPTPPPRARVTPPNPAHPIALPRRPTRHHAPGADPHPLRSPWVNAAVNGRQVVCSNCPLSMDLRGSSHGRRCR